MNISLVNAGYYATNQPELDGLINGIGNPGNAPQLGFVAMRSVNANDLAGNVYTLPDRLFGSDLSETDQEYTDRVNPEALIAINQVISGAKDAFYIPNEKHWLLLLTISGWPRNTEI